jgi:ABC-type sulfate transport system permease subunit
VQTESIVAEPGQPTSKRRPVRTWLIIETILSIPGIAAGAFMAAMSVMMFDAPGSADNPAVILLFCSIVGVPLSLLVGVVFAWIAFAMKRDRGALWFSLLPLLPVITGVVALLWLQFGYGGQLGAHSQ